ncbi:MAG: FtsX-like permease family protein [Oscillospiraceae bacterium]|nr:FtsX-like permease family protein [Oscillospiraceae bacterium]
MFWRILKKDLKRKKTMNIILLLFVILCSMFASASVNNISAVTGGIEHYLELANVPDIVVYMSEDCKAKEEIEALPSVKETRTVKPLDIMSSRQFYYQGKQLETFINPATIYPADEFSIRCFDEDNNAVGDVEKGSFYATSQFVQDTDIKPGDDVTIKIGETDITLKYAGAIKCPVFSTESVAGPSLLLNHTDYDVLNSEPETESFGIQMMVKTDDLKAVQDIVADYPADASYMDKEGYKGLFLYDMIAAYILMATSTLLMLTAFVVLRFSIGFTISEEFREIGVMKAVGIGNGSIRSLYIAKYLAISVIGAVIGFAGSIPLGSTMMKTVSKNIVLKGRNSVLLGLISAAAVVVIILLFCYSCTRRVRKLSPIDAVRSGQTGERFRKKSLMHLGRSKLPATGFLSANDVLSAPKRFGIITVIFAVCILLVTCMSNFVMTLKSDKIHMLFAIPETEVHILDADLFAPMMRDAAETDRIIADTEEILRKNGIPAQCTTAQMISAEAWKGDTKAGILFTKTSGKTDYVFPIEEGSEPQKADEIAVTASVLKLLDAQIGDRIKARIDGKEYEFIITGRFESFMSPGARMTTDFDFGHSVVNGTTGLNIHLLNKSDRERVPEIKELLINEFKTDKVYTTSGIIEAMTGMSETMKSIKHLMVILAIVVTAMIVVLMERSFISKEKSEIALMKAVGISDMSIIGQHVMRFGITAVLACILAAALVFPISNGLFAWICSMIGDVTHISSDFDPVDIFVTCPLLIIGVTLICTFLTALYTRTIKASDTASIE